jgi:hypothetical protein
MILFLLAHGSEIENPLCASNPRQRVSTEDVDTQRVLKFFWRLLLDYFRGKILTGIDRCNTPPQEAAYQKLCKIGYVKKEGHILPENRKATQKLRRIHPWIQQ